MGFFGGDDDDDDDISSNKCYIATHLDTSVQYFLWLTSSSLQYRLVLTECRVRMMDVVFLWIYYFEWDLCKGFPVYVSLAGLAYFVFGLFVLYFYFYLFFQTELFGSNQPIWKHEITGKPYKTNELTLSTGETGLWLERVISSVTPPELAL